LEDEAEMQEKEYAYLQDKIKQIQVDNENCQRELKNRGMTVEEFSKKQFEKNKKIKMLKTKIDLLERCLSQQVTDFEKERELLKF
jgi:peptidoglycan hydrolase CwlO-like protein